MAVYTDVDDVALAAFLRSYNVGDLLSFKGIAEGVENTNYLVETTAGRFILTLYEKRVSREDLPFFLGLLSHLAAAGVTCPTPVSHGSASLLGELAGRPAALFTFLDGVWPRHPTPAHTRAVGETLARLHLAAPDFPLRRQNALSVTGWQETAARMGKSADQIMPGLNALMASELEHLAPCWPAQDQLPSGVIHADLFPDNVFFLGDTLSGVIDFYFACNDLLAYDIAVCLNAWCFDRDREFHVTRARALLAGYSSVRPLVAAEVEALPLLARGAALRFLLTRAFDWLHTAPDAFVKPHDPMAYVHRLRFHQGINAATEYGLEPVQ